MNYFLKISIKQLLLIVAMCLMPQIALCDYLSVGTLRYNLNQSDHTATFTDLGMDWWHNVIKTEL